MCAALGFVLNLPEVCALSQGGKGDKSEKETGERAHPHPNSSWNRENIPPAWVFRSRSSVAVEGEEVFAAFPPER